MVNSASIKHPFTHKNTEVSIFFVGVRAQLPEFRRVSRCVLKCCVELLLARLAAAGLLPSSLAGLFSRRFGQQPKTC